MYDDIHCLFFSVVFFSLFEVVYLFSLFLFSVKSIFRF